MQHISDLGFLSNPERLTETLDIGAYQRNELLTFFQDMLLIRIVEEQLGDLVLRGEVKTPCHLGIGQEAVAVGVSSALKKSDRVFGAHRSHAHYLAMQGDLYALVAEVFGKADGCCSGMGGSMHLHGNGCGFEASVPIVAGTISIAVGAALAAKMDGGTNIGVAYFGDGAAEEGVLHESLNFAAVYELPVLFVCENNFYSSHLDIVSRQPSDRVSRFAEAHKIPNLTIDGNDVVAVTNAARELVQQIRLGKGPAFLEAVTYRWRGHVGANEDIDVGVRRKLDDLRRWKERDPIKRLAAALFQRHWLSQQSYDEIEHNLNARVREAIEQARLAAFPAHSALLDLVYA